MKFLNQYIFQKEGIKSDPSKILSNFENNFRSSDCHHKMTRSENKLLLSNDFFDFNYVFKLVYPMNKWYGIRSMSVTVIDDESKSSYLAQFRVSIGRYVAFFIVLNVILGLLIWINYSINLLYFYFLSNAFSILLYAFKYMQHRKFFNITIEHGDFYDYKVFGSKKYNWEAILKAKTTSELKEIAQGKTHHPDQVVELAKKELEGSR